MTPRGPPKKRAKVFIDSDSSSSSGTETYNEQSSDDSSENNGNQSKTDEDVQLVESRDASPQAPILSTQPYRGEETFASNVVTNRNVSTSLDSLAMVTDNVSTITPRENHNHQGCLSPPKVVVTDHKDSNVPTTDLVQIHDHTASAARVAKKPSKLKLKVKLKGRSVSSNSSNNSAGSDGEEEVIILDQGEKANHEKSKDNSQHNSIPEPSNSTPNHTKTRRERSNRNSPKEITNSSSRQDDESTPVSTAPNNTSGVKRKKRKVGNHPMVVEPSTNALQSEESNGASSTSKLHKIGNDISTKKAVPPKKKKTFQDQVLLHMLICMKPFTLKSLASELRTTDIALHHLMLSLVDKGIVRQKEFGNKVKKELYWVDIESATKQVYGNELPSCMDMENAKAELQQILQEESKHLEIMKRMEMELSNEELSIKIQQEETSLANLKERVQQAKDRISEQNSQSSKTSNLLVGGMNALGKHRPLASKTKPKTRNQLKKEINRMRNEWKARKEKCTDFIDNLSDAMEKKPKDVVKLLDIETDEMLGVKIPPKQNLES